MELSRNPNTSKKDKKKFNVTLENLYKELNKEIISILPMENDEVLEKCRQYEPDYRNETRFYLDSINKLDFGVFSSGNFCFQKFDNLNNFIWFYKENSNKYIIVDEYNRELILDEFLEDANLK